MLPPAAGRLPTRGECYPEPEKPTPPNDAPVGK